MVMSALKWRCGGRDHAQHLVGGGLIHHSDVGSRSTPRFPSLAGIAASIGSVDGTYHNALTETTIGLFKTEAVLPAIHERIRTELFENSLWATPWAANESVYHRGAKPLSPASQCVEPTLWSHRTQLYPVACTAMFSTKGSTSLRFGFLQRVPRHKRLLEFQKRCGRLGRPERRCHRLC
jgi:hypothetical protein